MPFSERIGYWVEDNAGRLAFAASLAVAGIFSIIAYSNGLSLEEESFIADARSELESRVVAYESIDLDGVDIEAANGTKQTITVTLGSGATCDVEVETTESVFAGITLAKRAEVSDLTACPNIDTPLVYTEYGPVRE